MVHAMLHGGAPIYGCWAVVAVLALAAAYNHRWHHTRDSHPTARLNRPSAYADGSDVPTR
jgi:hypothetical protein